jgi:hypothetical protein
MIKKQFQKSQDIYINKKSQDALFTMDHDNNKKLQKQRLIDNEEQAWEQHDALEDVKRKTRQIEGLSIEVMRDLEKQTGKMKSVDGKLEAAGQQLEESNNIITRMMRRENRNKTVIAVVGGLSIFAFLLIIYSKLM